MASKKEKKKKRRAPQLSDVAVNDVTCRNGIHVKGGVQQIGCLRPTYLRVFFVVVVCCKYTPKAPPPSLTPAET